MVKIREAGSQKSRLRSGNVCFIAEREPDFTIAGHIQLHAKAVMVAIDAKLPALLRFLPAGIANHGCGQRVRAGGGEVCAFVHRIQQLLGRGRLLGEDGQGEDEEEERRESGHEEYLSAGMLYR